MEHLPDPDGDLVELLEFAGGYDAYERWASSPEDLSRLLDPARREWDVSGELPEWLGIDALRALLFYEFRADYSTGGSEYGEQRIRAVCRAIVNKLRQTKH